MYAAIVGNDDIVNHLLEAGANIDAANNRLQTALMLAAARGHEKTVITLLDKGVTIEAQDYALMTAFDHAQEKGESSTMKILLAAGADTKYGVDMDQETKEKREISLAKIREEKRRKEIEAINSIEFEF
jgi:hypothetical protein